MKEIKESKRPGVVLIHREWCESCRTIGRYCRDDIPLIKMSKKFVMISCPNGEEPQDDTFKMGNGYIFVLIHRRFLFPSSLFYQP